MTPVAPTSAIHNNPSALEHLRQVAYPALALAPTDFVEEISARLAEAGIQDAVRRHDSGPMCDHVLALVSLQGISDSVAFGWDARHGGVKWAEVSAALRSRPSCPRLQSFWHLHREGCGYRKGAGSCAEPAHQPRCPLPRHELRKGHLNVSAYSLTTFVRDVCAGDLVAWLDASLAQADPGPGGPDRAAALGAALVVPLSAIAGTGQKIWAMILGELLLVGDPDRERWVTAGAGMIAVGSLVHKFLHRTGTLDRCGSKHAYGAACYAPGGCTHILRELAEMTDARQLNPFNPVVFPRLTQHAIWRFCSEAEGCENICNGRRINDRGRCEQRHCPAFARCDRVSLWSGHPG